MRDDEIREAEESLNICSNSMGDRLQSLKAVVEKAISRFSSESAQSRVRVGNWGPAEVLSHIVIWHRVSLAGIESVRSGGEPYRLPPGATVDSFSADALIDMAGSTISGLLSDLEALQNRIDAGAIALDGSGVTVRISEDGSTRSLGRQLEVMTAHIGEHLEELEDVSQ